MTFAVIVGGLLVAVFVTWLWLKAGMLDERERWLNGEERH